MTALIQSLVSAAQDVLSEELARMVGMRREPHGFGGLRCGRQRGGRGLLSLCRGRQKTCAKARQYQSSERAGHTHGKSSPGGSFRKVLRDAITGFFRRDLFLRTAAAHQLSPGESLAFDSPSACRPLANARVDSVLACSSLLGGS